MKTQQKKKKMSDDELNDQTEQPMSEHRLQNVWSVWEHKRDALSGREGYGTNMTKLCTFKTVEGFWRFANRIPPPSSMFTTDTGSKKFNEREIEGISVFKEGIRPEWEDPKNMHGGELSVRRQMNIGQLDQWWEDLLLGIIGETIDPTDVITGVRIVDKSSNKNKLSYKLEVWFECNQTNEPQTIEAIKENISTALNTQLKFEYKPHSDALTVDHHATPRHGDHHPEPHRTGSSRRFNN